MVRPFSELSVAVVGSVNLDLVANVHRFPEPGETVTGATVRHFPGGKGGNQALAARRLGARVDLAACLGSDAEADRALANLLEAGVGLDHCLRLEGATTGLALILVSADGENQIVVAPGANARFTPDRLPALDHDAVIAQLEVPIETVLAAASATRGLFCLNAAPLRPVPPELLAQTGLVVVNEVESRGMDDSLTRYAGYLAVTYGRRGAALSRGGTTIARAEAPEVTAVDTTGAGDAFTATLAVGLAAGMEPGAALNLACRAGAFVASRHGAQSAPTAAELGLEDSP